MTLSKLKGTEYAQGKGTVVQHFSSLVLHDEFVFHHIGIISDSWYKIFMAYSRTPLCSYSVKSHKVKQGQAGPVLDK